MGRPPSARLGRWSALVAAGILALARAAAAREEAGPRLAPPAGRLALFARGSYGVMKGSELENVDPARGFEVGAAFRALGAFSLVGSWAADRTDVKGQVVQLLDHQVRPDGRSGNVEGEVRSTRLRVGLRLDAYRERTWPFQPYFVAAAVLSRTEVTIDSVDGAPPRPIPGDRPGAPPVDISSFDQTHVGVLARAGVELRLATMLWVDLSGTVEILELPAGTNSIYAGGAGLTFRL